MAISPTVQQYQQNMAQGQQQPMSEEVAFNKTFGDAAYNMFRSKYADLTPYIITFKVVDSNIDEGNAIGTFIVKYGNDVVYCPVVLADGVIESCEMMYNKSEDTITPLIPASVKEVQGVNSGEDPTVVNKKVDVEGTRTLFRNMFRPPSSSHPVFASSTGIETLPNEAKKALSNHFLANPQLLAKVAEFYPIEVLTKRLALTPEDSQVKLASELKHMDKIITIDKLSSEVATLLSEEERSELKTKGYLLTKEAEDFPNSALSFHKMAMQMVTTMNLREVFRDGKTFGTGKAVYLNGTNVEFVPCLIMGDTIFTDKGYQHTIGSSELNAKWKINSTGIIVSDFVDGITEDDLKMVSTSSPSSFTAPNDRAFVLYPDNKTYKCCSVDFYSADKKSIDSDVYFEGRCSKTIFTPNVKDGKYNLEDTLIFPIDSKLTKPPRDDRKFVSSYKQMLWILQNMNRRLKLVNTTLTSSDKTASDFRFSKQAELVEHLQENYNLDKNGINLLLKDKDVVLFEKQASYTSHTQPFYGEQTSDSLHSTGYQPQQQLGTTQMAGAPSNFGQQELSPNSDLLSSAAELNDQDIMDTGMLASLAGEDNIKGLLVDMLPQFIDTCTNLGKSIILFTAHKTEFQDYYGEEEYNGVLVNIRRVFRQLGEVTYDLKKYTQMV